MRRHPSYCCVPSHLCNVDTTCAGNVAFLQGVPLLLGSFGTLAILLFGKPEAEPVRLWPIIAGQVGATAIVTAVLHVWGPNLISRAAAMAATGAWMMWSDCIHPPGGKEG